ncbi:MAG: hypothetical protein HC898_10665, partial [Phycisphaerales bacterium]|nr:hypothetical protein [Phycisphaerales bacterium]
RASNNPTVAADEYRIYAGARSLSGNTLGEGGPGGFGWSASPNDNGLFTQNEINLINVTTDTFQSQVEDRGQTPGGFASWGGVITFDTDAQTLWNFDTDSLPAASESDFLSVALHELAHTLGFGGTNEWRALTGLINNNPFFGGAQATAAFGSSVPLQPDRVHWLDGTLSTVYGTQIVQEAAMDPTLTQGTRNS